MKKQDKQLSIGYGVLCDPISKQLKEQGFNLDEKSFAYFDKIKEALSTLMFNGLTTDSMHRKLVERANKYIVGQIQKWYNKKGEQK